jgi:quercetin dioxygenase-like cupin family protein
VTLSEQIVGQVAKFDQHLVLARLTWSNVERGTGIEARRRFSHCDARGVTVLHNGLDAEAGDRGIAVVLERDHQRAFRAAVGDGLAPLNLFVMPWKYIEESTMSNEQVAPETKGVTVKLLATVDLGPEIEGMAGRQLRMRMVTIEPGGVFGPIHDHKDRPGIVYILQGTITDHRNGVATDYGPGVGWPEDRNTTHWLENRGTIPAVEISVDIVRQE